MIQWKNHAPRGMPPEGAFTPKERTHASVMMFLGRVDWAWLMEGPRDDAYVQGTIHLAVVNAGSQRPTISCA